MLHFSLLPIVKFVFEISREVGEIFCTLLLKYKRFLGFMVLHSRTPRCASGFMTRCVRVGRDCLGSMLIMFQANTSSCCCILKYPFLFRYSRRSKRFLPARNCQRISGSNKIIYLKLDVAWQISSLRTMQKRTSFTGYTQGHS